MVKYLYSLNHYIKPCQRYEEKQYHCEGERKTYGRSIPKKAESKRNVVFSF